MLGVTKTQRANFLVSYGNGSHYMYMPVLVQMCRRKHTLIATSTRAPTRWPALGSLEELNVTLSPSSVGANELASSIAISDRKLHGHARMVDLDPTAP